MTAETSAPVPTTVNVSVFKVDAAQGGRRVPVIYPITIGGQK